MRNQQKRRKEKRRQPSKMPCFFFFLSIYIKNRWLWVIKTKEDERKKKKQGILEGCLLFPFLLFCWFLIIVYFKKFLWSKFGCFFLYFEGLNNFEFLKFWKVLWDLVRIRCIILLSKFFDREVFPLLLS